jgi:hypothetical protein
MWFLLIPLVLVLALAVFAPSHTAQAAEGGLPNFNTAEGDNALASLTSGNYNTANGSNALLSNSSGSGNTATGLNALFSNTDGIQNTATGVNII